MRKIIGVHEDKYIKWTYLIVLLSAVLGFFGTLAVFFEVLLPASGLTGILGLASLTLPAIAWLGYKNKISELSVSHAKYMTLLHVFFMMLIIVLMIAFGKFGFVINSLRFIVSMVMLILFFIGYKLWVIKKEPTKENLKTQLRDIKNNFPASFL